MQTAEPAGKLLEAMVPAIGKTSDLVQEIAAASGEQSGGVKRVNGAIGQLSQATQQNASTYEELAVTAEEMSGQAEHLQQLTGFFKLDGTTGAPVAAKSGAGAKSGKGARSRAARETRHFVRREGFPELLGGTRLDFYDGQSLNGKGFSSVTKARKFALCWT